MTVLLIFGSTSDKQVYQEIEEKLCEMHISCSLKVVSAHKSPHILEKILQDINEYEVIIAGAGLAAHLPGAIAAATIRPVIGVPVKVHFQGVDSLLSILQMPSGVPVLTVGVNAGIEAAQNANLMLLRKTRVNVVRKTKVPENLDRNLQRIFHLFTVEWSYGDTLEKDAVNIIFVDFQGPVKDPPDILTLHIPVAAETDIEDIRRVYTITKQGLWLGMNRAENAAIAAVQILNLHDEFSPSLLNFKDELERKFLAA